MSTMTVTINENKLRTIFGLRRLTDEQIQLLEEYTRHIECTNFCEAMYRLYQYYINDRVYLDEANYTEAYGGQELLDNLMDLKTMSVNKNVIRVDALDMYISICDVFDILTKEVLSGDNNVSRLINIFYNKGHILCHISGK